MALISEIDLRGRELTAAELRRAIPRAELDVAAATDAVTPILAEVHERGAAALRDLAERFDGVRPTHLRVPAEELQRALEGLDPTLREALDLAATRVRAGHEAQLPTDTETRLSAGGYVRQRWVPVNRVGLYVPGGLALYPSSVVMNVVAAQVAGVRGLAVASPPQRDNGGLPDATVLAACALLGVEEVYAVGGAQAVAMFAYGASGENDADGGAGSELCAPVDVITGPGNVYVAAAKRAVRGIVGIDSEAGPTEIAILADATANPDHVAADLVSQAEHDPNAASVLVTDSPDLAAAVTERLEARAAATKHTERVRTALGGPQSAIVLVDDVEQGLAVVNAYAAEHLEIQTANAEADAARITSAGAVFVGAYSPVSLGDYLAGSNHVLPTGGCAHYSSGLGVMSFMKSMQVISYDAAALAEVTDPLVALAGIEDLPAHGEAALARREG
ncbi:histidinol dehydrogenase [Serinibacter salmoneus]|uniref:Histidinol dehydrogenase n=1 Tax=Serinibacter salmoneus TaxID=556530 RepID=A0A2A9CYD1_9MICO|nr:histidinol dehydrogenase [Serinibacter salmoneus]PFG19403.1 histidinol dehydrogenase [Serinibacter salmoneus]